MKAWVKVAAIAIVPMALLFVLFLYLGREDTYLQRRVQKARSQYHELAANPEKVVSILVSFKSPLMRTDVEELYRDKKMATSGVYRIYVSTLSTHSGGSEDCEGKSIEVIINQLEKEVQVMLDISIASATRKCEELSKTIDTTKLSDSEKDQGALKLIQAYENHRIEMQQYKEHVDRYGVELSGINVHCTSAEALAISKSPLVEVVEILDLANPGFQSPNPILSSK